MKLLRNLSPRMKGGKIQLFACVVLPEAIKSGMRKSAGWVETTEKLRENPRSRAVEARMLGWGQLTSNAKSCASYRRFPAGAIAEAFFDIN